MTSATVRVRAMNAGDIDGVLEIAAEQAQAPQWPRRTYEAALDQALPRCAALVADIPATGKVAGFAIASVIPPEGELESIAVSTACQRQGVARLLFEALAGELGSSGVAEILLEVRETNRAARAFYSALGFIEIRQRPRYYADPVEDAVLMQLSLKDACGSASVAASDGEL